MGGSKMELVRGSNMQVVEAEAIHIHTLEAGQKLPRGAVVVTAEAQEDPPRQRPANTRATHLQKAAKRGEVAALGNPSGLRAKPHVGSATAPTAGSKGLVTAVKVQQRLALVKVQQRLALVNDVKHHHLKDAKHQKLMFARTTASATWPSEKNPLKDFDADFLQKYDVKGFPTTTATADWPFTKNPLLGFDEGFRNSWKGYKGPEHNVYAQLPAEYPFLETKLPASMSHYKAWSNAGALPEVNVYDNPAMWPNY